MTAQMQRLLSGDCVLMSDADADALKEELAARDEALLEAHFSDCAQREDYLDGAHRAFLKGALFPVLAGSALTGTGVDELMRAIAALCKTDWASRESLPFAGQVYRVRRVGGVRYAYVKATAGVLRVRDEVSTVRGTQKVSAMMLPQGGKLTTLGELSHTRQTIVTMTRHMERLLPMLLTLLTALGGSASSAFLHPMVAAASGSMVFLAREVILRLVMCTCAVTAVNHLSDRAHLTRMAQLLRGAVCWLLGVSFTVFLGAMSLQGVTSASIDGVAIRAAKYAVDNFVPVVGGMFSDTMDTLVGCTLIVKNALGVAAVLVLVGALVGPLLRTLAVVFMLRLSAALLEPIADGDIVCAIGDFSRTVVLFFITMLCVGTMYFLLIVQVLLVGNLTVLLR